MASENTPEAIMGVAENADALLVTYAKITADMIERMTRCRIVSRFGIGVDNVDLAAATRKGIVVTKVPDYCIDEVSDHAMALLLAVARKIPMANAEVHGGTWHMPSVVPIHRLRSSVLGLVGFGRIPQLVAPKAQAFGLHVIAYDPYVADDVFAKLGVERVEFSELLKTSDYVSIHSPLLPETRGLFNGDVFRQMKPTAYVINTARGPIVDEAALIEVLQEGKIAGAGLDVMEVEPLPADSPLNSLDNVLLAPHLASFSDEGLHLHQLRVAKIILDVYNGKMPERKIVINKALYDELVSQPELAGVEKA
jgi:D-3-phosphoglycerate dehydrogenase